MLSANIIVTFKYLDKLIVILGVVRFTEAALFRAISLLQTPML